VIRAAGKGLRAMMLWQAHEVRGDRRVEALDRWITRRVERADAAAVLLILAHRDQPMA